MKQIEKLLKANGIDVVYMDLDNAGYYDSITRVMFINENATELEIKKAILHELGHGVLHDEFNVLYRLPVPKLKMENEADCYMIDQLLKEYLSINGIEVRNVNYMKFIEDINIDPRYEETVKELLESYSSEVQCT